MLPPEKNYENLGPPTPIPLEENIAPLIADTGSTANFGSIQTPVINKRPTLQPITVRNANGSLMHSTHEAELDFPNLPPAARHVHILPDLKNHTLISIGQLCDAGCDVTFDATTVTVKYKNNVALTGIRTPATRLWQMRAPTQIEEANAAIGSATPEQIIAFSHATLFSPALTTLESALKKGYLTNFPGLTAKALRKYPPRSYAMVKGHLDQVRKNQGSTKPKPMPETANDTCEDDAFPTDSPRDRSHECFAAMFEPTGQIYSDQTGKFITPSSQGNNYLMIVYDYDSNSIFAEPFKTKAADAILSAYKRVHVKLCAAGLRPQLQRLDNECSNNLKQFMKDEKIDFQLVPPGSHRRNAAERAIRTFKNHFIAGLCSLDKDFPMHLWDQIVPQAEITLNLLRGSRVNPKVSAWAHLNGTFDFNRTPIAPPGIRVLIHEKADKRTSWSPHALDGWYIGPALDSYRCYKVWVWETRATRICDTISWFPTKLSMPIASSNDMILAGVTDILHTLNDPSPSAIVSALTDSHVTALRQLTSLLTGILQTGNNASATPPPTPPLRVVTPNHSTNKTPVSPLNETPPVLRVDPTLKVLVSASTTNDDIDTYDNTTGPTGKSRRRRRKKQIAKPPKVKQKVRFQSGIKNGRVTKKISPRTASQSKTSYPSPAKLTPSPKKSSVPEHRYSTRANSKNTRAARSIRHLAATALQATPTHSAFNLFAPPRPSPDPLDESNDVAQHFALHGNAFNPDTGKIAEYAELRNCSDGPKWRAGCADEFGRLLNGHGENMPTGTETMFFIHPSKIPKHKKPTYMRIVAAYRPEKKDPYRVRFTCGGDRIEYFGDVSTKTADMTTVKCLINDTLSTPNAKCMMADLSNFYLETPMADYEYMRIPRWVVPDAIMEQYKLKDLVINGNLYVEIRKGMYGLPQSGRIANDRLIALLKPHGYAPVPITPGLWKHDSLPITFALVVDDFAVKYTSRKDAEHLMNALKENYSVSEDWAGTKYCGISLKWDYDKRTCDLSMPGYIERALQRFQHPHPARLQHSPHEWQKPNYGAKTQYAQAEDTSEPLDAADTKRVQEVLGTLLFYARAVDPTMLVAIGDTATQQAKGTKATMQAIIYLLNYCATHPDAIIRYHASDMCLHVDSDASYLSVSKARSRIAGFHYLSSRPSDETTSTAPQTPPPTNGAILTPCMILKEVVSSAAEAELAGAFHNGKEACPIRITLEELGYPQPATIIVTDNSTAAGISNDTVKQKRSKAIDMRFYWIRDRVRQGQFRILWKKGILNKADYFTKHHPASHHQQIRSSYLHIANASTPNYFEVLQENEDTTTQHDQKRVIAAN